MSYVIKLLTASGGSEIQRETNETVFNVTGLDPDTEYRIEMKVLGASQRESKFVDLFVSFKTLISRKYQDFLILCVLATMQLVEDIEGLVRMNIKGLMIWNLEGLILRTIDRTM